MNNCESDKTKVWRVVMQSNNELLAEYTRIYNELARLLNELLTCCGDKNDLLDEIINRLDVLIQNLIDCCEKICDKLDIIIDIIIDPIPESEWSWKTQFTDRICYIGDDLEGPDWDISFDDRICQDAEEWPVVDSFIVSFDDRICKIVDTDGDEYIIEFNDNTCQIAEEEPWAVVGYEVTYDDYTCQDEWRCDVSGALIDIVADDIIIECFGEWVDHTCAYDLITTTTTEDTVKILTALDSSKTVNRSIGLCDVIASDTPPTLWFPFYDSDGAGLTAVRIESIPLNGFITKGLFDVIDAGDVLLYPSDFSSGIFYHGSVENEMSYVDTVGFSVKTDEDWSDNIGTLTFNVDSCSSGGCTEYGLLYNWYAATDARNISADGWRVPVIAEVEALRDYLGAPSIAGGALKETGLDYWNSPNTGATNETGFSGRGAGFRIATFASFRNSASLWLSNPSYTQYGSTYTAINFEFVTSSAALSFLLTNDRYRGASIRLLRDATIEEQSLTDGTSVEPYVGNDGISYKTVKIGTYIWLAENLMETKFRNGDVIPWHGANPANFFTNAEWAALTSAGVCAYDNNASYVGCDFTGFPTE